MLVVYCFLPTWAPSQHSVLIAWAFVVQFADVTVAHLWVACCSLAIRIVHLADMTKPAHPAFPEQSVHPGYKGVTQAWLIIILVVTLVVSQMYVVSRLLWPSQWILTNGGVHVSELMESLHFMVVNNHYLWCLTSCPITLVFFRLMVKPISLEA